ncbi:MAG: gliding motility-associated ABC transporter ATP-binding subunit GldA [Chitinophagaceae bacterium]
MSIEVAQLLKIYGSQKAVNNISFSIKRGEIVGFLGPNGAGKSTTLKMITGYLKPDGGVAKICAIDVNENPIEIKKRIGYLPEANPLYFDMYVKEYLQFIAGVHQIKNSKFKIQNIIELTGLTVESNKKIGQLSKGYKQRAGLAAALLHDPEVLILDEPTSGLDPNQIVEIRNVIKQQGQNKTVLFSSHILQEVQAICDRIIIINKGELVADDSLHNLQHQTNNNIVKVVFKEKIEQEILQNLSSVDAIKNIDLFTWQLFSTDDTEVRKQLLQLALDKNFNITSLQTEGNALEDIFRSLTQ